MSTIKERAKIVYELVRNEFERTKRGKFVSIEPVSGEMFVGETFDDAVNKAVKAYPNRITHTIRVGHEAAFHIGLMSK